MAAYSCIDITSVAYYHYQVPGKKNEFLLPPAFIIATCLLEPISTCRSRSFFFPVILY